MILAQHLRRTTGCISTFLEKSISQKYHEFRNMGNSESSRKFALIHEVFLDEAGIIVFETVHINRSILENICGNRRRNSRIKTRFAANFETEA